MLIFLIIVFLVLQAADLGLTLRGLALGKRERNPLALFLMRRMGQVQGLVFLKVAGLACFYALAIQLSVFWQIIALAVFSVLGLLVVLHNVRVLRRASKTKGQFRRGSRV